MLTLLLAVTLAASPVKRDTCDCPPKPAVTQAHHHRPINPRAGVVIHKREHRRVPFVIGAAIVGVAGYLIGHDGRETRTITVQAPCPSCGGHHRDCGSR